MDNTIFALADIQPGQSLSRDKDGTLVLKESSMKIDFHSPRPTGEGAESNCEWRRRMDRLQTQCAPWSAEVTSEEPQENGEERRPQDQDQEEDK